MGKRKDTAKPKAIHQRKVAVVLPAPSGRQAGKLGRKSKLIEVSHKDIEWMPLSSPEEVLAVAKAYASPPARSIAGVALRIAKTGFKPKTITEEPAWVKYWPDAGRKWRREQRAKDRRAGIRLAFAEMARLCYGIDDAMIPPVLEFLAEALRIGPKLRKGLRSKGRVRSAAVHEAYAIVWSKKLDGGGREKIEREREALQNEIDRRGIGLDAAQNLWNNVKNKFLPTRDEVRANLEERIGELRSGDEAQKSTATELREILQGKHFSDYAGSLKFAERGKPTA